MSISPLLGKLNLEITLTSFLVSSGGGEKKRTIERDMNVPLIFSKFFVELHYRTVIASGKCKSISLFVQRASRWERLVMKNCSNWLIIMGSQHWLACAELANVKSEKPKFFKIIPLNFNLHSWVYIG
jgi:hypothetical protein